MSVMIDDPDELRKLLKSLNLKVGSVDELRQLLATINANYNPEAARQKTGRMIGFGVPTAMAGAAAVVSFFLVGGGLTPYIVGGLALIWGAVAVVSTAAVIASALMTSVRRRPAAATPPAGDVPAGDERVMTDLRRDLSL